MGSTGFVVRVEVQKFVLDEHGDRSILDGGRKKTAKPEDNLQMKLWMGVD